MAWEWECLECDTENEEDGFPFGGDVLCQGCGVVWETDWEYTNGGDGYTAGLMAPLVVRIAHSVER